MERQVIFRDRQELQAADFNNVQAFLDETLQHMMMDSVTTERIFTGFAVTMQSATELAVAEGRLWDGVEGKIYTGDAQVLSLFSNLPVQDQKWLAVSVRGQEDDTDLQPRDFLIDLQSGQTEPSTVAMVRARTVATHIASGLESPTPEKPAAPTGYTLLAYVRLTTNGIQEIVAADTNRLHTLLEVYLAGLEHGRWIAAMSPIIESLKTDMAGLADSRAGGSANMITQLAADIALLKEQAELPDNYAAYAADPFLLEEQSDLDHPEYYARVEDGLRFPWAGEAAQQLALFNPYESSVENRSGLVLPAYDEVVRLETTGDAGNMNVSQYAFQTRTKKLGTRTVVRVRYGSGWVRSSSGKWAWQAGGQLVQKVFDTPDIPPETENATGWTEAVRTLSNDAQRASHYQKWVWKQPYWYVETTTHQINGAEIAQTILVSQNGWLTSVGLEFAGVAGDGVVHLSVCETVNGAPDPDRTIAMTSVEAADLEVGEVRFEFAQPVYLEAGKRYALVLNTAGDHWIKLVPGESYSQGTLFASTDGAFFQANVKKDWKMKLYYARFQAARVEVPLEPVSLSEGMSGLDLRAPWTEPPATSLVLEYQKSGSGTWTRVDADTASEMAGLPALCNLRAVYLGSQDLMPGLELPGSKITATRPATVFTHVSTLRELSAPSADIDVIVLLEGYDEALHECTVTLIDGVDGVTEYAASDIEDTTINNADGAAIRRAVKFAPNDPAGISSYKIKITGASTSALETFVVAQRMDVAK